MAFNRHYKRTATFGTYVSAPCPYGILTQRFGHLPPTNTETLQEFRELEPSLCLLYLSDAI
jgi:hypothetical protein